MPSRSSMTSNTCSACRKPPSWRWRTVSPRLPAGSRSSISTWRPGSATPWACSTTPRRRARHCWAMPSAAPTARSPVLLTAGQQDQDYIVTEPILSADLPTLVRPFVKWAAEVHRVADLPRLVHRAVKTALAPPTGPVFLSLPGDILKHEGDLDLMTPTRIAPRLRGDAAAIAAAAALLAEAKHPLIIAGDAVAHI